MTGCGSLAASHPAGSKVTSGTPPRARAGPVPLRMRNSAAAPVMPARCSKTACGSPAAACSTMYGWPINVLPGKASLHIHQPIDITSYSNNNINELMDKIKAILEN